MSGPISNVLKNDFACVEVCNLAKLAKKYPDFPSAPDGRGPFTIWQVGVAPGDMTFTSHEFLLTREGKWLPLYAFIGLEVEERRKLCIFETAVEATQCILELSGPALVDIERIAKAKSAGSNI